MERKKGTNLILIKGSGLKRKEVLQLAGADQTRKTEKNHLYLDKLTHFEKAIIGTARMLPIKKQIDIALFADKLLAATRGIKNINV